MNKLRIKAISTGSLLCVSLCVVATASAGEKKKAERQPIEEALAAGFFERLDANKDGQVTRAEADAVAQQFFDRLDANKDGEVTAKEADAGALAMRREELGDRFKALDANGDGRLTLQEAKMPPVFFERIDANRDKVATREEFLAVGQSNPRGELGFRRVDANRDGKVTRTEGSQAVLRRFASADPNDDGVITRAELDAHIEQKTKRGAKGQRQTQRGDKTQRDEKTQSEAKAEKQR